MPSQYATGAVGGLLNTALPKSGLFIHLEPLVFSLSLPIGLPRNSSRRKEKPPPWALLAPSRILLVFGNFVYDISRDLSQLSFRSGRRWLGEEKDSLNCQQEISSGWRNRTKVVFWMHCNVGIVFNKWFRVHPSERGMDVERISENCTQKVISVYVFAKVHKLTSMH